MGGGSGYDGHRKIKGWKRNTVVDTLGMILAVVVVTADADEVKTAPLEPPLSVVLTVLLSTTPALRAASQSTTLLRSRLSVSCSFVKKPWSHQL